MEINSSNTPLLYNVARNMLKMDDNLQSISSALRYISCKRRLNNLLDDWTEVRIRNPRPFLLNSGTNSEM